MRLDTNRDDEDLEVDMSPMIDMVFLLLIFFIVTSTIIDEKVPVRIPQAAYAKIPENTTGRLVVSVKKDNKIFVGPMPVTLEQLTEQLASSMDADPNLRILIRSDREVKYKTNEKIMLACAEVGASDLIYSAYEE
ncbi:MAG: biopolymer transporter ExbD [Verrucomicrobia bacterium]|nr:biopolymer transporter ExbD [Verrucomicrobiota bacterium]